MPPVQQKTSTARIFQSDRAHIRALQDAFEQQDGQRPSEQQVLHWAVRALEERRELEEGAQP